MRLDDETTAYQLHGLLTEKGHSISLRTILRCRTALGWTYRGSTYCQLIQEVNKGKRLAWAREHLDDTFDDIIWSDECIIQMESHYRFACRNQGEAPRPKPRYDQFNVVSDVVPVKEGSEEEGAESCGRDYMYM